MCGTYARRFCAGRLSRTRIRVELGPSTNDMTLSLALDMLLDDFRNGKWLAPRKMLYVGNLYVLLPDNMYDKVFTLEEARSGANLGISLDIQT